MYSSGSVSLRYPDKYTCWFGLWHQAEQKVPQCLSKSQGMSIHILLNNGVTPYSKAKNCVDKIVGRNVMENEGL